MGNCCNVRTLSYISAALQLLCWVILSIFVAAFFEIWKEPLAVWTVKICWAVVSLIAVAFLVTLIVGIKQNRVTLVSIYVYATIVILAISVLGIIYSFADGFVHNQEIGSNFRNFFDGLEYIAIYILIFTPIFVLHRQMLKASCQREQDDSRGS